MSESAPRDETVEEFDVEDLLEVFAVAESPAITTRDVAVVLGWSPSVARRRLNQLYNEGLVKRRDTGQTLLWWAPQVERQVETVSLSDLEPVDMGETNAAELAGHAESEDR